MKPAPRWFNPTRALVIALGLSAVLAACTIVSPTRYFALSSTPDKTVRASETPLARSAQQTFWEGFHAGRYAELPESLRLLTAAYLETPNDPELARLLGLAHLWNVSERERVQTPDPRVTDSAILSERYLQEAYRLEPKDGRLPGFIGVLRLALGSINDDPKLTTDGYLTIQDGVSAYPEFNLFVLSVGLSQLPAGSERFNESVEAMWHNFEVCANVTVSRDDTALARLPALNQTFLDRAARNQLSDGVRRACTNTQIAPYNLEGFFMHWGDVLVKQGRTAAARTIYGLAKMTPTYQSWPYRAILEDHVANLEARAVAYKNPDPTQQPELVVASSAMACVVCHQSK